MRRTPDSGAHPRSRGENAAYVGDVPNDAGSSPLTRGKRACVLARVAIGGLIPAHAGKTHARHREPHQHQAHPRSRGENQDRACVFEREVGSSPLTRGKLARPVIGLLILRLIPAHAGKTRAAETRQRGPVAHPRSRGENICPRCLTDRQEGSSPLTRGKPEFGVFGHFGLRLIPAHAGKTSSGRPW